MTDRITVGIATCLTGESVRYDGGHKRNTYLMDTLGRYVDLIPICPESECGLPIPREAMDLMAPLEAPRMVTVDTGIDHTPRMQQWIAHRLDELEKQPLCGYILKSKSPSCGMENVPIYHAGHSGTAGKGAGLFASAFMDRFPHIPVEDENRLDNAFLRENFIRRLFVCSRWQQLRQGDFNMKNLIAFHTIHKLIIMAHAPQKVSQLGRLISQPGILTFQERADAYISGLMNTLKSMATVKKNVNVLQHIQGYFKKDLQADEKQELNSVIEAYRLEKTTLDVPISLLNHYVHRFDQAYLKNQIYLTPHPQELMLRNHV